MGLEKGAVCAWRDVKAQRRSEAEAAAAILGADIEFLDVGDYPLRIGEAVLDRLVDVYRELKPAFVLTHALRRSLQLRPFPRLPTLRRKRG